MICHHCDDEINEDNDETYFECPTCADYYCSECGESNCPTKHLSDEDG